MKYRNLRQNQIKKQRHLALITVIITIFYLFNIAEIY